MIYLSPTSGTESCRNERGALYARRAIYIYIYTLRARRKEKKSGEKDERERGSEWSRVGEMEETSRWNEAGEERKKRLGESEIKKSERDGWREGGRER